MKKTNEWYMDSIGVFLILIIVSLTIIIIFLDRRYDDMMITRDAAYQEVESDKHIYRQEMERLESENTELLIKNYIQYDQLRQIQATNELEEYGNE